MHENYKNAIFNNTIRGTFMEVEEKFIGKYYI